MKIRDRLREKDGDIGLALWMRLNGRYIFFGVMLLTGIAAGAFLYVWLEKNGLSGFSQAVEMFVEKRKGQPMAETFISAVTPNMTAWLLLLLCGFCAVSAPITALMMVVRGMGYGILFCALLTGYQSEGLRYICVYLMPNLIISAVALIFCCCDTVDMSGYFWQAMSATVKPRNDRITAYEFCGKMLLYAVIIAAGAAAEAYCYSIF